MRDNLAISIKFFYMRRTFPWLILVVLGIMLGVVVSTFLNTHKQETVVKVVQPLKPVDSGVPFPQINPKARALDIPIIMYHDVLPVKDVDWDITPKHLEKEFQTLRQKKITPITLKQLVDHLQSGSPLPPRPILLSFDDNYLGEYLYAFPLLKKYNYPAVWSIHTNYVGSREGKPKANWSQVEEMSQSGLVTVASHTVNHLRLDKLSPQKADYELRESKRVLESHLGVPIDYFTYPEGDYIDSVKDQVAQAGYKAALTMSLDENKERPANKSDDLLSIMRYGQSRFEEIVDKM